jgi:hypothetical protein
MPFIMNEVSNNIKPSTSRRTSTSSVLHQAKASKVFASSDTSSPLDESPLTSPSDTPRESPYPEVSEIYHNTRLDPKNFLEGQSPLHFCLSMALITSSGELSVNPATRLRQMLARPGIVVAPGICDGISARAALDAGFTCLYQSGAATTASRLGMPDLAIATLNDFVQVSVDCTRICVVSLTSSSTGGVHGRFFGSCHSGHR